MCKIFKEKKKFLKKQRKKFKMNTEEFKIHGKSMVDYICGYMDTVGERNVAPTLDPGYLKKLIPSKCDDSNDSGF